MLFRIRRLGTALSLLLASTGTYAHHGLANFNLNIDQTIEGTIIEVALINPHSWIYVDVPDKNGGSSKWKCELRGGNVYLYQTRAHSITTLQRQQCHAKTNYIHHDFGSGVWRQRVGANSSEKTR